MGMTDTDDLGDVTDYVYAGALAFERARGKCTAIFLH